MQPSGRQLQGRARRPPGSGRRRASRGAAQSVSGVLWPGASPRSLRREKWGGPDEFALAPGGKAAASKLNGAPREDGPRREPSPARSLAGNVRRAAMPPRGTGSESFKPVLEPGRPCSLARRAASPRCPSAAPCLWRRADTSAVWYAAPLCVQARASAASISEPAFRRCWPSCRGTQTCSQASKSNSARRISARWTCSLSAR